METRVQEWGKSLAVRFSNRVVRESNIRVGTLLAIGVDERKIILEVKLRKQYTLRKLLARVKRTNIHRKFEAGPAVGKEIW
jgi:antitoxin component of MazEF toxin-antitoxin module